MENQTDAKSPIELGTCPAIPSQTGGEHSESFDAKQASRYKTEVFDDYIKQRGTRYRDCRLSNFKTTCQEQFEALEKMRDWSMEIASHFKFGQGVILFGPVGGGKDHLMTGLIVEAIKAGVFERDTQQRIRWSQGPRLFSMMRDSMGDGERESLARQPFTSARLLVLSDVCQSGQLLSDFQRTALYDIIDRRYSFCRSTWITTNAATREELETMIGDDLADRLLHGALVVRCGWPSFRRSGESKNV